jgi:hypothetical protein
MNRSVSLLIPLLVLGTGAHGQGAPATPAKATPATAAPAAPAATSPDAYLNSITLLRMNLRARKADIVGKALSLPDSQATVFWPLYREYEAELVKLWDQRIELIKHHAMDTDSMDAAESRQFFTRAFDIGEARLKLDRDEYNKFAKVLPTPTVNRFFQVSGYLERLLDVQVWGELPEVH